MVRPQMQPPLRGATAPTFGKPPLGEARRSRARTVRIRAMYQSRLGSAPSTAGASVDDVPGVPEAALARHRALPSREAPWSPRLGLPGGLELRLVMPVCSPWRVVAALAARAHAGGSGAMTLV